MIIRSEIDSGRYTALPNSMVRDRRLSFAARGVMGYLIMRNQPVALEEIQTDSSDDVPGIIRELERFGYVSILDEGSYDNTR